MKTGVRRCLVSLVASLLSLLSSRELGVAQTIIPATGSYVFEVEDFDWNFGKPTQSGIVIFGNGDVFRYADPGKWRVPDPETKIALPAGFDSPVSQKALDRKFQVRTLIGHIPIDELKSQILVIAPTSWGHLVQVRPPPPDMNVRTHLAYTFNSRSLTYQPIKLRQTSGDGLLQSNAQAGVQLSAWIDLVTVPDVLSATCGGVVVLERGPVSRVERDGTVERWAPFNPNNRYIRAPSSQKMIFPQQDVEPLFERAEALDPTTFVKPSGEHACILGLTLHGIHLGAMAVSSTDRLQHGTPPTDVDRLFDDVSSLIARASVVYGEKFPKK